MREQTGRAVVEVLAAAVLFGTTGTAQALGPDATTPLGVGSARLIVGGLGLVAVLPMLGARRSDARRLVRNRWALLAGLCTALYQVAFFAAVDRAGVAVGTLVTIGSGPVLAGLLSWRLLGQRPDRSWMTATALCVVGLGLLSGDGLGSGADGVGIALALASGLGYATYTVAAKRLIAGGEPSSVVMAVAFGLGGALLVPVLASQPIGWLPTPGGAALALYLGLVTTTAAYVLFGRGLAVLDAGPVTTLVLAEPLVATALGLLVLDERLEPLGIAGAVLVAAGLGLQGRASAGRRRAAAAGRVRR